MSDAGNRSGVADDGGENAASVTTCEENDEAEGIAPTG